MKKVFIGMSGGVDSSVTAALLVKQGFDVTGVYMKNWSRNLSGMHCSWAEDLADAKRVAVKLNIDFEVYDFETEYKQKVVDYMIDEYKAGKTPNPDIMCNQEIKFKLFFELAQKNGADLIATGHYARVKTVANQPCLALAADQKKDQTYFLYRISKNALAKTIFPLGDLTKARVRELATEFGLVTAAKKDSQGICFIGQIGIEEFLQEYIDIEPGDIIESETGVKIGQHRGAVIYTVGQRHGLDLGGGLPYYVVAKDMSKNQVIVSRDLNQTKLWSKTIKLEDLHWIYNQPLPNRQYLVRVRHQSTLQPAQIKIGDSFAQVIFDDVQKSVVTGQSVVIYDKDVCLGGGIAAF